MGLWDGKGFQCLRWSRELGGYRVRRVCRRLEDRVLCLVGGRS